MSVPRLFGVLTLALAAIACGAPQARQDGATRAGLAFEASLSTGDYREACALLAPESRRQLQEDERQPCERALPSQELPSAGDVRGVDVYGRQALLRLRGETLFLSQFDEGWRVTAAGCEPNPGDAPCRCALKGA
ncbi:hypothetical protein [Streptomyces sp. NPDC056013]|uniref:hypothetical protein n=1 Tax=Streptomyces sp. NPDC056013 TaxID=3345680 RepID=UPI0035D5D308